MEVKEVSFLKSISYKGKLDFFTAFDWLEKSIKRWLVDEALYYLAQFLESGEYKYLFKRLMIILVKDIWLANPYLWKYFFQKLNEFENKMNDGNVDEVIIYEIVIEFALSPKNREAYYFICSYYSGYKDDLFLDWFFKKAILFISKLKFKDENKKKQINELVSFIYLWKSFHSDKRILKLAQWFVDEMFWKNKNKKVKEFLEKILYDEFFGIINKGVFDFYEQLFFKLYEYNWKDWLILYITFFELYRRLELSYDKSRVIAFNKNTHNSFEISKYIKSYEFKCVRDSMKWKVFCKWLEHFVKERRILNNEVSFYWNKYTKIFAGAF